jgi:signal peptidase II
MRNKFKFVFSIAVAVFIIDHITKYLIVSHFSIGEALTVIPNIFDIVHVRNEGAAFGVMAQWDHRFKDVFFYLVFMVALGFLYYFLKNLAEEKRMSLIAVALVFGGALGNIVDRFMRGSVVDFLSFHWYNKTLNFGMWGHFFSIPLTWPAFNVADSAICVGVFLLVISMSKEGPKA